MCAGGSGAAAALPAALAGPAPTAAAALPARPGLAHTFQPILARAQSGLEVTFFELCEGARLPLPELNARVMGWEVDALWREQRVAVELDGPGNHRTPAQIRRDRRKELELRAAAFVVLRYSDEQVHQQRRAIAGELRQTLRHR